MANAHIDVVALGSCYVDTNTTEYPFKVSGIPVETELVGGNYETIAGGSAVNFCRLLGELGLQTAFVGMTGTDPNGDMLNQLLEKEGVRSNLIQRPDLQTNVSFNMTNPEGQHIMLVAGTANAALNPDDVLPKLEEVVADTSMVYLGGCFKLKAFGGAFSRIADIAKQHSTILVIDHGRIPEGTSEAMRQEIRELAVQANYYFPSRDEFCELWDVATVEDGLRALNEQAPSLHTVVKDGANGAYLMSEGAVRHVDAVHVENAINVTGAGDSFNAGTIAAIAKGRSLAEASEYGCLVAAARIKGEALPQL